MAIADNLLNYYKMDESWTSNASDSVWWNTAVRTNVTYTTGKINNWASYSGSNSYHKLTTNVAMPAALTIAAWIYADTLTWERHIFGWANNPTYSILWFLETDWLKFWFKWYYAGWAHYYLTTNDVLSTWTWYHLAVTLTWWNTCVLYLNWSSVADVTLSPGSWSTASATATNTYIWAIADSANKFDWILDEVWLWDRVLSSTEISTIYNWWNWLQYPFTLPWWTYIKSRNWLAQADIKSINWVLKADIKWLNWLT